MSAQLTLDCLSGIDWERPRLEQLEQAALNHVLVRLGLRRAWMKPSLQRTALDTLEWVVLFQEGEGNGYVDLRSDEELESALASVFEVEETPDTPRYKAMGNSMAVPVMRWIGERIQRVEEEA